MSEYNCFSCDMDEKCEGYTLMPYKNNVCLYKLVAYKDLRKYEEGDNNITLLTMLEKYLEKKEVKEFKTNYG